MYYSSIIVDDEHLIRSSLMNKINNCHNVIAAGSAANGLKCLEWLTQNYADICITDVQMPHMDGLELIHEINERYPWITCIVVSSHDDFTYVRKSLQLSAVDYVLKPVEQSMLSDVLGIAVRRLQQIRKDRAVALLLKKIDSYSSMLERWVYQLQTVQVERIELLIVETLEMLEEWVGHQYYLLNELSIVWLELVLEKIKQEKIHLELEENNDLNLQPKMIPWEQVRFFFRLVCVGRLEQGARKLFEERKGTRRNCSTRTIEQVKQYLQQHYSEKINLQEVADAVAMSRTYLSNLFKQETGTTIWNYLISIRMLHARKLLLGSSLKSYEIALKVGYENSIHFSKLFKDHYGLTPMDFKKRMQD
jgi:two-component system response regulator YesN